MNIYDFPDELLAVVLESTEDRALLDLRATGRRFAQISQQTFVDRFIRTRGAYPIMANHFSIYMTL